MQKINPKIKGSSYWNNLFKSPTAKNDILEIFKAMPTFSKVRKKYLKELIKLSHNRVYSEGEMIFHQHDPGIGLYIIHEGEVVIVQEGKDGGRQVLAELTKGDFFGELALLDDSPRSASAIAKKDSRIVVLFKPDLDEFMDNFPQEGIKIAKGISQIIATRLRTVNEDYLVLLKKLQQINGGEHAND
jgi:CRP-like cAMP-binding protein